MTLFRPVGERGATPDERIQPGDVMAGGENILSGSIVTAGNGTWTAAAIATGMIRRTGPGGGYTDTTDSATNILVALAGNNNLGPDVVPGTTFRMLFINTVAFAMTLAAGTGVVLGTGTVNCAASLVREYLFTVLNASLPVTVQSNTTNGQAAVTFVLPANQAALPIGPSPLAVNITPGMTVTGTNIAAGTTVLGVTQGQGGITGVTLSQNATGTTAAGGTPLTFGPTIQIDGIRSSTL